MKEYYVIIFGLAIMLLFLVISFIGLFGKHHKKMKITTRQITKDAIFIALLSIIGMISIPMGENIKISLQFLLLIIIFGLCDSLFDCVLIPTVYLILGLFIPIYAGFMTGITPTFGFILSFVIAAFPFYFIYRYLKINYYLRYIIASVVSLIVVYVGGTLFFMFYLNQTIQFALLVTVVPYIPFDVAKIIIATLVMRLLPKTTKPSFIVSEK